MTVHDSNRQQHDHVGCKPINRKNGNVTVTLLKLSHDSVSCFCSFDVFVRQLASDSTTPAITAMLEFSSKNYSFKCMRRNAPWLNRFFNAILALIGRNKTNHDVTCLYNRCEVSLYCSVELLHSCRGAIRSVQYVLLARDLI